MCIWKWCIEGWVIVSVLALILFALLFRGCSDYNATDNILESEQTMMKITAGYEQCPMTDSYNADVIWVKNCTEYMTTRGYNK